MKVGLGYERHGDIMFKCLCCSCQPREVCVPVFFWYLTSRTPCDGQMRPVDQGKVAYSMTIKGPYMARNDTDPLVLQYQVTSVWMRELSLHQFDKVAL
jgi:hypothetical protein